MTDSAPHLRPHCRDGSTARPHRSPGPAHTAVRPAPRVEGERLDELFRRFRRSRDRELRNRLVEAHLWVARMAARQFSHRSEPLDDLQQVALLGLVKAVERFDPDHGAAFSTFALPTVRGELQRHFRDATWAVHVPRDAKELTLRLKPAVEELTGVLGRAPSVQELADRLELSLDRVLGALEASGAYRTDPLTSSTDRGEDERRLAKDDDDLGGAVDRVEVRRLVRRLPARERRIVYLRFYRGYSQRRIADAVGLSQVHVSRLLRTALASMGEGLGPMSDGDREHSSPDAAAVVPVGRR